MRVLLFMAMSLNGIIARKDGDEDFLSHRNWETFCSLAKEYGNFIVGRKTYEVVKQWKEYSFNDLTGIEKVVISENRSYTVSPGYTLAHSSKDALEKLSRLGFERVLLAGGAATNAAFAKAGFIDEVIVNVEPVVVGEGVPVFSPGEFEMPLQLVGVNRLPDGIIELHYRLQKHA